MMEEEEEIEIVPDEQPKDDMNIELRQIERHKRFETTPDLGDGYDSDNSKTDFKRLSQDDDLASPLLNLRINKRSSSPAQIKNFATDISEYDSVNNLNLRKN